ncbi:MAG: hypothetical protein KAT91_02595 [Candidatus Aenigmarchaeota archaeon]|nr:hypothetical protein [Candidatus Aenigmarchaeota archaeon]
MDSIEDIRKRKMEQYAQESEATGAAQEQQLAQAQAEIDSLAKKILSPEAFGRIANIRTVKPDFALQVEMFLVQMHQSGQIKAPVDENTLVSILDRLTTKKETKITRR